jgi:drug/metabolite transporter (DMT)-like permease
MSANGLIYFFLFACILVGVYISMRRRLANLKLLAAGGIFGGIITMTLFAASQENVLLVHALLVGFLVGGGMSLAVIVLAWYFISQELRATHKAKTGL